MEIVPMGLYRYIVEGERETEAAAELDRRVDAISRNYHTSEEHHLMDLADTRADIEREFAVKIKVVI